MPFLFVQARRREEEEAAKKKKAKKKGLGGLSPEKKKMLKVRSLGIRFVGILDARMGTC